MAELVPLRHNRDFRRLWVSQALSDAGSHGTAIGYPLLVLALTGSAVSAGAVATVASLVRLALRLPAGVLVDRLDRRRLMLGCEAVRVVALAALGIAVLTGRASLGIVVIVAVVDAGGYVLFGSAERAALRHLVPAEQLSAAAAANEARAHAAELTGPPIGGLLFGLGRALPFLADAVSYLISMVVVTRIRRPLQEPRVAASRDGLVGSLAAGWRFVAGEPFLRAVAVIAPLLNMAFVGVIFVLVVVLQRAAAPPTVIGLAQAGLAASGLLGAAIVPGLRRLVPARWLITGLFWLMAAGAAGCAVVPPGYWSVAPLPVMMFLAPAVNATLFAHQTVVTPDHLHGRVISVLIFLATLANPVAPILGGFLADTSGGRVAFAFFAGCLVLAAVVATMSPGIRRLPEANDPAGGEPT